jgi:hypothetical protein
MTYGNSTFNIEKKESIVGLNFNPSLIHRQFVVGGGGLKFNHTFLILEQPIRTGGVPLLFGHKNRRQIELQVDLGDLQNEKEQLSSFLQSNLKVSVVPVGNKLGVNSIGLSVQDLQRTVTKFIYHRNFNRTHWASIEGKTVKINRFEHAVKKKEKPKENALHQTAAQSWGL